MLSKSYTKAVTRGGRLTPCDNVQKKMLNLDIYRQPLQLRLPDASTQYRTFNGSIFSIMTVVVMLVYGVYKMTNLVTYSDYAIQMHTKEHFFNDTDAFGSEQEFWLAGGVTAWDGSSLDITDPSIGQVKFYKKDWYPGSPFADFL